MTSLAVIGGGITGLAAARQGVSLGCDVTVFEASDRWGGCIDTTPLAGHDIDVGPDAFLCREASAVALCDELGLTLTSPAASSAGVLRHGMLRQIPRGTLLGIPGDPMVLRKAGMVGWAGALRASIEPWLPLRPLRADTDIASFVKHRIGASVFNATVGPLVGSIHAGRADDLSVRAVIFRRGFALLRRG